MTRFARSTPLAVAWSLCAISDVVVHGEVPVVVGDEGTSDVAEVQWDYVVGNLDDREVNNTYDAFVFRNRVEASDPRIVWRECPSCAESHKNVYYKRLTSMPDDFDLLDNLMNNWFSENNLLNVDFALYSSYEDAATNENPWQFCNYDDPLVGFPRDCGPDGAVTSQWNQYRRGGKPHAFYLPKMDDGAVLPANLALGKPARQYGTAYGGDAGRAVDGNSVGVYDWESVTHTYNVVNPYWEVDLTKTAAIRKVRLWNRWDCCAERLSDVLVEIYDAPWGRVVASRTIEGQASRADVVHFDDEDASGVEGRAVRVTLTSGNRVDLSLAEVVVEGDYVDPDASPASTLFPKIAGVNFDEEKGTHPVSTGAVGHFDDDDHLRYDDVDFGPEGTTVGIMLRYSKGNDGGRLELRVDDPASGPLLATLTPVNTGGWDKFTTASVTVANVAEAVGVRDLYLVGKDAYGVFDVLWFELTNAVAFTVITDYRVNDDDNARDVQCTYDVLAEAFQAQTGRPLDDFLAMLGVDDEADAVDAARNMCAEAQNNADAVPFDRITVDYGSQFVDVHYQGHGPWNEETETLLFPSDGDAPAQRLKTDAAKVKEYYEISRGAAFALPDLPQFDPSVCASKAAHCCFPRDRQANDNNGNCATPYDENCVDKDVADNTDACYNELTHAPYANHVEANGFTVFDQEGPVHCHGFAWANDGQETLSRYKGNALFFVSMYDHMYQRGYVENIPGSPMCGCVEHMPVVSRSDCTQTNVQERYTFSKAVDESAMSGVLERVSLKYQSCQGANNNNNDLAAYVQQLVDDGKLTAAEQNVFKTRVVGNNQCAAATESKIRDEGFERGYAVDPAKWTYVTGKGFEEEDDSLVPVRDSRLFREMFEASEVPVVRRVCLDCRNTHENIYYRRLTNMPEDFDLLDTLTNNWFDENNAFNVDFALYSSYADAVFDENRWEACNFNDRGVGFPRDCGPDRLVGGQWTSSYKTDRRHAFLLPANPGFSSGLRNIAPSGRVRQYGTAYDGSARRAVDGDTNGAYGAGSVTHTSRVKNPYWEVEFRGRATVDEVWFWNRVDCCDDRLSDVLVELYDEAGGNVVASRTVEGKAQVVNAVDMGGAEGRAVRISLATGDDSQYLSLAEVQVDGEIVEEDDVADVKFRGVHFDEQSGTRVVSTGAVGFFDDDDHLTYDNVDFGDAGSVQSIIFNHSKGNRDGRMEVRLDGPQGQLLATFVPENTGGWDKFLSATINLDSDDVAGVHDLTFVAKDNSGVLDVMWFQLSGSWAFTVKTEYKVNDDDNARDAQCTYDVAKEAFQAQTGKSEADFLSVLGASDAAEAETAVYALCGGAQEAAEKIPYETFTSEYGSQFVEIHYQGHGPWNEQTETLLFPSDGDAPAQRLKTDAAKVNEYYDVSQGAIFGFPDLPQFDPSVCASNAAHCCWPRDRQANDNNGNCATPYDENCVDKDVADNTDLCYNELEHAPYSSHVEADGFTVFDEEGPVHCHGFAWANDDQETLSRYKGNALFFVSMYDHMHQRGYVENIAGSPMCGCVEHMPVVSRSDCTQTNVQEHYTFTMEPDATELVGSLDRVQLQYQSCQGANNNNNDLQAYVQQLVNDGKLTTTEQDVFKTRIIGNNQCAAATESLIADRGFERGFDVDDTKWTFFVGVGDWDGKEPSYDARLFKEMVEALEVPIVRRVCVSCRNTHKDIYYRRLTDMPEDFDLLDLLMNNWFDENNAFNEDFALYSSHIDAFFDVNRWQACNFNDSGVGFPRDCGPDNLVGGQWNSYYRTNREHAFLLPANPDFVSQLTNIARGRPVRQINVSHGGVPERAVDGKTLGAWNRGSVTHTHHAQNPWWEVDLEHYAALGKMYIWNRIDCCTDRLSNLRIDVYDEPYGNIVDTKTIDGQLKQMTVLDLSGVSGQIVRVTRQGSAPLSLAEVEIEGELGPSPTAAPTRAGQTNIALDSNGAVASQSRTSHGGAASRAIDGNTSGFWQESSITHTPSMNQPSWFVTWEKYFSISRVEVYNRVDCCNDRIRDFVVNIYRSGVKVYTSPPNTDVRVSYTIEIPYVIGNKVEILIPHNGRILSLAEVMVFGVETEWEGPSNMALSTLGAVATQSSTGYGGDPSRAIDGNQNGHWGANSVTHTRGNVFSPYWEVQLDDFYNITYVEVYNRLDCCSDRIKEFELTIFAGGIEAYSVQAGSEITPSYSFEIPGIVGDKVQVMLPGAGRTLSLAEVVVLGVTAEYDGPILPNNVALATTGATAFQSATSYGGSAARAIDGNRNGMWSSGSITHTPYMANPFWEVTLNKYYSVSRVEVYNRLDCCSNRLENFVLSLYRGGFNVFSVDSDDLRTQYSFVIPNIICDKVNILIPGNGKILSLAEVMVYGEEAEWNGPVFTNVALASNGGEASQSSVSHGGVPSRAIDGNVNGGWRDGSVTHTSGMTDPFWEVALDKAYYVARLDVYNRVDCCSDRIKDFVVTMYKDGGEVYSVVASSDILTVYSFVVPNISADKVRITLLGNNRILSLAEVQVLASETAPTSKQDVNVVQLSKVKPLLVDVTSYSKSTTNGTVEPPLYDDEYNATNPEDYDPDKDGSDFDDAFDVEEESNDDPVIKANADFEEAEDETNPDANETDYSLDDTITDATKVSEREDDKSTSTPTASPVKEDDDNDNDNEDDDENDYNLDDTGEEDDDGSRLLDDTARTTASPTKSPTGGENPDTSSPTLAPSTKPTGETIGGKNTISPAPSTNPSVGPSESPTTNPSVGPSESPTTSGGDDCRGSMFPLRTMIEKLLV